MYSILLQPHLYTLWTGMNSYTLSRCYIYNFSCPEGLTWKETFVKTHKEYGRYITHYSNIRGAWNKIEKFLARYCPSILESLKGEYRIYPKYSDTLNVRTSSFFLKRHLFYVPYISGHVPYRVFLLSVNVRTPKTCPLFLIKLLFFTT